MRINLPLISAQYLTCADFCVLLLASGCARSWYREQADHEAANVVAEKVIAADDEGMLMNSTTRHWKRTVRPASFSKDTCTVDDAPKIDSD